MSQQQIGMVQTDAGLVVPADAMAALVQRQAEAASGDLRVTFGQKPVEVEDRDGRRRVVLSRDEKRLVDRAVRVLLHKGFAFVLACIPDAPRAEGKHSCGQVLRPEGRGADGSLHPDHGYGCQCSRIHLA